jgi:thiamine-phosphate diphosphorylase/hydroxyethylthiazole kinase
LYGTTLSAYLAANPEDKLHAAVAGLLHFEIAAQWAARHNDVVRGPGTFVPSFLDQLWDYGVRVPQKQVALKSWAKVQCVRGIPDFGLLKEV